MYPGFFRQASTIDPVDRGLTINERHLKNFENVGINFNSKQRDRKNYRIVNPFIIMFIDDKIFLPYPPFVQQSGYDESGAPLEHLGGGRVGGGGGGLAVVLGGGGGRYSSFLSTT